MLHPLRIILRKLNISRTKEVSVAEASQPQGNVDYAKLTVNSKERDDLEGRKISKRSANSDVQPSNAEKSAASRLTISSNGESDYAEEEMGKEEDDKDVETSDLVRLPRDVSADKYTDENEESSLYDEYETKDVAKRGIPGGPGDYEEAEDNSPEISEDMAALEEPDEGKEESDSRVKRDQAVLETLDKLESGDPARPKESRLIAEGPLTSEVSHVDSPKSFNRQASTSGDSVSKIEGSAGSNRVISRSSSSIENKEPANVITSSNKDKSSVEYGKRVEEEIQRKIDSIKEEIKRDIEAQQRIRDIEENNARFDELRDRKEDEEGQNWEGEPIEKRQIKRSVREIADPSSFKRDDAKRCLKGERQDKLQRRPSGISRPDTLRENLHRRFAINRDKSSGQAPSQGLFKKKRERARQTFLVNNDRRKRRRSRSYTPSDRAVARPENELFTDFNSYRHAGDAMVRLRKSGVKPSK